ncbi:GlmU family protein [Psychroflexus sediminis]|uniref:UDP-N-acetylglucosamine diphosphorylase/glucosamine-1-phosphate N-acetyltransferase n=1 Tax=Psychroflexus sediminis TaxID=470826 RepID=A0A1G7WU11_9FLAO|nr:GlmU family protein [Psychroflexus sediminis]SDG74760.1 UDP-N-acetylglucosamine diphosphorylase/glucosamine-1-phosphate N-acetyltransferase [Psychroflexus sediminis]
MNIILFDDHLRSQFLPLTYTRPVAELRLGILTLKEKWEHIAKASVSYKTQSYLAEKYPEQVEEENIFINARYLASQEFWENVKNLNDDEVLKQEAVILAYRLKKNQTLDLSKLKVVETDSKVEYVESATDLFSKNHKAIQDDFSLLTEGRTSQPIPETVTCFNPGQIFIEEGAKLYNGTLNASEGPIYIGKKAEVMENSAIRGPFALCEHSTVKMGAKIYTGTSIGPHSKVGGEVSNSMILGYSNKGHDGFLGNSVIGEWCNLGADTNTSNLKNNYANVKLWDYDSGRFKDTGLQFCGLIMGDHSKCSINMMLNTGTLVGVSANIFGSGFPRNFVPSFSWGGSQGVITYKLNKVFEVAELVMKRRGLSLTKTDKAILENVFEMTSSYRRD